MSRHEGKNNPVILTDSTLEGFVRENRWAIIDCWASWCPPCRALSPIIDRLAEDHGEVAFGKLNVDENPETPRRYGIMAIPTLLYFRDGRLVDRTVGLLPREALRERVKRLLGRFGEGERPE